MKNLLRNISMMAMAVALAACSGGDDDNGGGSTPSGGGGGQTFPTPSFNTQDHNKPIGFGASITGSGDGGTFVTVDNLADLRVALSGTDKKTIYVKGTLTFPSIINFKGVQNKTIYGLPGATFANTTQTTNKDLSGIMQLENCSNIIIRNITFKSAGAYDMDGHDNLEIQKSSYIWVDHCDFQDGVDGNLDCTNASDNICVTWCRFRYLIAPRSGGSGGSNDHRFSNLWGNGDESTSDNGKLNTTFANCWWDEGCKERMPRVRYGKVHILNCLYSSSNANYCVGGGYKSNIYIEKCAFTSAKAKNTPWKKCATATINGIQYFNYNYTITGCVGTTDKQERYSEADAYFTPTYSYDSYDASQVSSVVGNTTNGAGATLTIHENEKFTTAYKR